MQLLGVSISNFYKKFYAILQAMSRDLLKKQYLSALSTTDKSGFTGVPFIIVY